MANSDEVERLRRELTSCPGNGSGRRYPDALRRRAGRLADVERREGRGVDALARRLGVSSPALTRWMHVARGQVAIVGPLVPVEIVPDEVAAPSTILVRGPRGLVVEGLAIEQIAELVRRLA
jgi:transposase-like protein